MSGTSRCGFCTVLSEYVNRAMCVRSRRGSNESYYRELGDQATLQIEDKTVDSAAILALFPRMRILSRALQETFTIDDIGAIFYEMPTEIAAIDRYFTLNKRPKRRPVSRLLLQVDYLNEYLHLGQVQSILGHCGQWCFNAFILDYFSNGRALPVLCLHIFELHGLISHFKLDMVKLYKLLNLVEEGYHVTNPYHNAVHAADVTQAMHCFLKQNKIRENMSELEVLASLLAAIAHDVDHPGVNQQFLSATSNHLAALYEHTSVLENHHWRAAICCIQESGLLDDMPDQRTELEELVSSLILATDISRQQEYLTQFQAYNESDTLDLTKSEHRRLVLQIALKCADISNPCRPWAISQKWSFKVCEEFFRQGDSEKKLQLPVTGLCDRSTTSIPKIQTGFFKYVVTPLITEWHKFLKTDLSALMLENLVHNQTQWEQQMSVHTPADDTYTDISDAELVDDDLETSINLSDSSEMLLPRQRRSSLNNVGQKQQGLREQLRRFSVPQNVFQDSRCRQSRGFPETAAAMQPDSIRDSVHSVHSDISVSLHCETNPLPEKVLSSEKLLPDSSIAFITTPLQATWLNTVFRERATSKVVRQQKFPPLELNMRAQSYDSCTSSNNCMSWSRNVTSDSWLKFGFNFLEKRFYNMFRRSESEKTDNNDNIVLSVSSGREGTQFKNNVLNLNSVQLNAAELDLLTRRRKSMPTDTRAFCSSHRERRDHGKRQMIPELLYRSVSGKEYEMHRRDSEPATSEARVVRCRPSPLCSHFLLRAASRRSSLPVEALLPTNEVEAAELK